MARPKNDDPEMFSSGEIAHGTGFSVRQQQFMSEKKLTPPAQKDGYGKKGANLYDLDRLTHFSLVGALNRSGLGLTHASRLALQLYDAFNDPSFGYLSGISRNRFSIDETMSIPTEGDYSFWLHNRVRLSAETNYRIQNYLDNDIIVLIADGRYCLLSMHTRSVAKTMAFGDHLVEAGPDPLAEILESEDGEEYVLPMYMRDEYSEADGQLSLLHEYRNALANATGVIRVNLSLAIRNCADRVHDLRMEKGGKIFRITPP